ncbi:hypothetical protein Pcinc_005731 [Petrolisthes cinctipes]|uniref:Uncharacterized protein n=1 Tax=Petrolisthes cinctipes TaxID=88211 RepID=A0AAE1GC43_PETCI|nr:hypothetical protein Pcinc_005731 [Petrolisthes cinctipes]
MSDLEKKMDQEGFPEDPEEGEEARQEETQKEEEEEEEPVALLTEEEEEKPPSYEAALVEPPPYDLHNHLTPTQPRSQAVGGVRGRGESSDPPRQQQNFLEVPRTLLGPRRTTKTDDDDNNNDDDDEQDAFLPSYHDAIRLSFCSDTEESQHLHVQSNR